MLYIAGYITEGGWEFKNERIKLKPFGELKDFYESLHKRPNVWIHEGRID
jgi:hypothetical protein